jgi:hypothetical protein
MDMLDTSWSGTMLNPGIIPENYLEGLKKTMIIIWRDCIQADI